MIVLNYQIVAEVLAFHKRDDIDLCSFRANELIIPYLDAQAWCSFNELPNPEWIDKEMKNRVAIVLDNIEVVQKYKKENGDLFGVVVDPDDGES